MMRAVRKLALAGIACAIPAASLALEASEIFKRADPGIVVISTSDKSGKDLALGSGVLVAPRDVVTNCHVLKDAIGIAVKQPGVQRSARLRYQDTARDLCQILLDDALPSGKPVSAMVPSSSLEIGQQVYAIGAPQGLDRTLSRGIISALRDMKDSVKLIQTDAAIAQGSSGGGLFDAEGRLIGIVTFGIGEEGNLNFAIPTEWIQQLASRNRDRSTDAVVSTQGATAAAAGSGELAAEKSAAGIPRVGDRWKYRLLDGKRPAATVVVEIIDARGQIVSERVTREGQPGFSVERSITVGPRTTRLPEIVTMPGGFQLTELAPYVPLGQTMPTEERWTGLPVSLRLGAYGYGRQTFETQARVVGRERITVPAGKFDTVRVQMTGEKSIALDLVRIICTYWYSEDSMRTVKMSLEIRYTNKIYQTNPEIYELVAYEPAK
jgi:hypothetical protein